LTKGDTVLYSIVCDLVANACWSVFGNGHDVELPL
jgi:hypothetical protein